MSAFGPLTSVKNLVALISHWYGRHGQTRMSMLKMNYILVFVQGTSLAVYRRPAFPDDIAAFVKGLGVVSYLTRHHGDKYVHVDPCHVQQIVTSYRNDRRKNSVCLKTILNSILPPLFSKTTGDLGLTTMTWPLWRQNFDRKQQAQFSRVISKSTLRMFFKRHVIAS